MSINKKLLKVQQEVGAITKDSTNPFFKSKYFDINKLLEIVKPVLSNNGLVLIQPLNGANLDTLVIDTETGESIKSSVAIPQLQDPQKMGSVITYFRRYSLCSLLALQAEDDDANSASNGHTDPAGLAKSLEMVGKFISKEQADNIRKYLVKEGYDADGAEMCIDLGIGSIDKLPLARLEEARKWVSIQKKAKEASNA